MINMKVHNVKQICGPDGMVLQWCIPRNEIVAGALATANCTQRNDYRQDPGPFLCPFHLQRPLRPPWNADFS